MTFPQLLDRDGSLNGPLAGLRVLDLTSYLAGPYAANLLAQLGAEVIKIESCDYPEPLRLEARGGYLGGNAGDEPWNRSAYVSERHRNKLSLALDLLRPEGRDLFERLVRISDIVIEAHSDRTLDKMRLRPEDLRAIKSTLIVVSMSSRGRTGPDRTFVSYGTTLMMLSGVDGLTAYPGQSHDFNDPAYPDPVNGLATVGFTLGALHALRERGVGNWVDVSQLDVMVGTISEYLVDASRTGRQVRAEGNRSATGACSGIYRCSGQDAWIAITVRDDEDWRRLTSLMGQPELQADDRFRNGLSRREHIDDVDEVIEGWTTGLQPDAVEELVVAAGLICGRVRQPGELLEDAHLEARGWFDTYEQPGFSDRHRYRGMPFRLERTPALAARPAPRLGEHNEYVLSTLLGLSSHEVAALESAGVIGTRPTDAALRRSGLVGARRGG